MPLSSLRKLEDYEREHSGAIAIGHPNIVNSGRSVNPFSSEKTRPKDTHRLNLQWLPTHG
jgi:polysaccharide deacetylase 2 family uncharacterized protein YibQ